MEFGKNHETGRPQGTEVVTVGGKEMVVQYSCNPPREKVLRKHKIFLLGRIFGLEPREVVLIPKEELDVQGIPINTPGVEAYLAKLK